MKFHIDEVKLILKRPLKVAGKLVASRTSFLLRIDDGELQGWGEAPVREGSGTRADHIRRVLEQMAGYMTADPMQLEENISSLRERFDAFPEAISAVDTALHDLVGKKLDVPVYAFFGLSAGEARKNGFHLAVESPEEVPAALEEAAAHSILKIRLTGAHDVEIVRAVRERTNATLRVDAGARWSLDEATQKMPALRELGVEHVEQPLAAENLEGHSTLKTKAILPIILDESVRTSVDIPVAAAACDGIKIKLARCGGLREAWRMTATARAHGLSVMLGSMIESSVGVTAAAHLSPLADSVDLDGNFHIVNDPYRGVISAFGEMLLPDGAGLGLVDAYEPREWHD